MLLLRHRLKGGVCCCIFVTLCVDGRSGRRTEGSNVQLGGGRCTYSSSRCQCAAWMIGRAGRRSRKSACLFMVRAALTRGRIYAAGLSWKGEHPSQPHLDGGRCSGPHTSETHPDAYAVMHQDLHVCDTAVSKTVRLMGLCAAGHSGSCNNYRRLASSSSAAWARVVPVIFLPPSIRAISSCRAASSSRSTRLETECAERVFSTFR